MIPRANLALQSYREASRATSPQENAGAKIALVALLDSAEGLAETLFERALFLALHEYPDGEYSRAELAEDLSGYCRLFLLSGRDLLAPLGHRKPQNQPRYKYQ